MDDEQFKAMIETYRAGIGEYGWMVVGVTPTENSPPGTLPFAYTVGLTEKMLPELIATGVNPDEGAALLNCAAEASIKDPTLRSILVAEVGAVLKLRPVWAEDPPYIPNVLPVIYPDHGYRLLQVLWPDDDGCHPDGPGFSDKFKQVVLD